MWDGRLVGWGRGGWGGSMCWEQKTGIYIYIYIYKIMLTMGNQFYPNILCLCQLSILLTANIFTLTKVVHYQIPENSIILKKKTNLLML